MRLCEEQTVFQGAFQVVESERVVATEPGFAGDIGAIEV